MPQLFKSSACLSKTTACRRPGPYFAIERSLQTQSQAKGPYRTQAQAQTPPQSPFPSALRSSSSSLPISPTPSAKTTLRSLFGLKPSSSPSNYTPAPFTAASNPYTTRKSWPPDFSKLAERDRFHYEKTFRRRAKLKWARPTWTKSIKMLQWGLVWAVVGYWVFFLEVEEGRTPFQDFQRWVSGTRAGVLLDPEQMRQPRETPRDAP